MCVCVCECECVCVRECVRGNLITKRILVVLPVAVRVEGCGAEGDR